MRRTYTRAGGGDADVAFTRDDTRWQAAVMTEPATRDAPWMSARNDAGTPWSRTLTNRCI